MSLRALPVGLTAGRLRGFYLFRFGRCPSRTLLRKQAAKAAEGCSTGLARLVRDLPPCSPMLNRELAKANSTATAEADGQAAYDCGDAETNYGMIFGEGRRLATRLLGNPQGIMLGPGRSRTEGVCAVRCRHSTCVFLGVWGGTQMSKEVEVAAARMASTLPDVVQG